MSYSQQKIQKIIENKKRQNKIEKHNRETTRIQKQALEPVKIPTKIDKEIKPQIQKTNKKFKKYEDKVLDNDMFSAYSISKIDEAGNINDDFI